MASEQRVESLRQKVGLLLLDKLGLALALAAAGYLFSLQLQRHEKTLEYQKVLFESRRQAYVELLKQAKNARDECALLYLPGDISRENVSGEVAWRRKFDELRYRAQRLEPRSSGAFGGGAWTTYEDALKTVDGLERIRRENALYVSESVDLELERFVGTLSEDISRMMDSRDKQRTDDRDFQRAAWVRAITAYESIQRSIRKSMRVDEIILG